MEGRTRHQRDHGGRGPVPAPVPRHLRRARHRRDRALDPVAPTRGRYLGDLPRRTGRPFHDGRGLHRAPARGRPGRRRPPAACSGVRPGQRRTRTDPGVHPDLAGAVRAVVLARPAGAAAGADAVARLVPAQRLRLGVLGAADGRAADDRERGTAHPLARIRRPRAAHRSPGPAVGVGPELGGRVPRARRCAAPAGTDAGQAAAAGGTRPRRAVDPAPPGGRRRVGRYPASVGLLDPGPAPARLPGEPPGPEQGARRAGELHGARGHRRRPGAQAGGMPVPGVGHRAGRDGAAGLRHAPGRPGSGARGGLAARRGDPRRR